jgi:hypothetical protein
VVSTGVRLFALFAALALGVVACAQSPSSAPPPTTTPSSLSVNPARIDRARTALPGGYEVAALSGRPSPVAFWGLGPDWTAEPPQCGALADPAGGASARGWSASGAGGIVYAVVADSTATLEPSLLDDCGQWTVSAGHTGGTVGLVAAPAIEGAATVGLSASTTTTVEGGTETHSRADTFTAYLGDYVAVVTVVGDPGSPNPQLGLQFASDLLVKTVSALRG